MILPGVIMKIYIRVKTQQMISSEDKEKKIFTQTTSHFSTKKRLKTKKDLIFT